MTLLSEPTTAPAPAAAEVPPASAVKRPAFAGLQKVRPADLAMLVAGLWWALPLTHASGGRSASHEAILLALLTLAAVLVKPWQTLPKIAVIVVCWVSLAALIVPAVSPTGWRGADDAASYVCAAMAFLVAAGWAQTSTRRTVLVAAISLAGLDQVCDALVPWWGGGDPSAILTGTFYWHNPFAAFLLPGAVFGIALVAWRIRPFHLIGWFTTPLCTAGIVYSSSRATLGILAVAAAGIGLLALRGMGRGRLMGRWSALVAITVAVVYILPGQPLFAHRVSPFASSEARSAAGETLATNGSYRLEFWRSALATIRHHPLVGSGYHGLVETSEAFTPGGWARSNLAHNGYLQAFSDGGLLLGVPVLLASLLLATLALRSLFRGLRSGQVDPLLGAASIGLLGALAHSAIDFDWSHSALFVMDALVGAVIYATPKTSKPGTPEQPAQPPVAWLSRRLMSGSVIGLLLLGVGMGALGYRDLDAGYPEAHSGTALAALWTSAAQRPLASDASARGLLGLALGDPTAVSDPQRRLALAKTSSEATVDLALAETRAEVSLQLHDRGPALALLPKLTSVEATRPAYSTDLAPLLAALGDQSQALAVLQGPATDAVNTDNSAALSAFAAAYGRILGPGSAQAACVISDATTPHSCAPAILAVP